MINVKKIFSYILIIIFSNIIFVQAETNLESPISIPKIEGSKNFDLEISKANQSGIGLFKIKSFKEARHAFKKAQLLSQQLRDPAQGIVSFNLGLSLHKLGLHENAVKYFMIAKKYARGNSLILNSKLVRLHECGFNPSIICSEKIPAKMHIEGSD